MKEIRLIGYVPKRSILAIRPTMESASKEPFTSTSILPHELVSAMRTHIVECPYLAVLSTHHENGGLANRELLYEIIAGILDLLDASNV
jgi:hypothetical protein